MTRWHLNSREGEGRSCSGTPGCDVLLVPGNRSFAARRRAGRDLPAPGSGKRVTGRDETEPPREEEPPGAVGLQRWGQRCCSKAQPGGSPPSPSPVPAPRNWEALGAPAKSGGKTPLFPAKIRSAPLKGPAVVPTHGGATRGGDTFARATALPDFVRLIPVRRFGTVTLQPRCLPDLPAFPPLKKPPQNSVPKSSGRKKIRKNGGKKKKERKTSLFLRRSSRSTEMLKRGIVPLK